MNSNQLLLILNDVNIDESTDSNLTKKIEKIELINGTILDLAALKDIKKKIRITFDYASELLKISLDSKDIFQDTTTSANLIKLNTLEEWIIPFNSIVLISIINSAYSTI